MVRITEELLRKSAEHNEGLISSLEEVALHQRDIEKIEHIGNWCRDLKILDLTSNLIPKIENLHKLKKLEYLKVGLNNIERIENLEGCESLKKLDLTVNFIGELTSIESLQDLEHLREMYLMGNPCTEFDGYREFVAATLPRLKFLDGHEILKSERLRAMQEIHEIRSGIIQQQKKYFLRRQKEMDEARTQDVATDEELTEIKKTQEDEAAEEKRFWDEKVSYTPESRLKVHEHIQKTKEKNENSGKSSKKEKKVRKLEADDGRILNINEAKFDFTLTEDDQEQALILDIAVYKYMDTSLIDIDINPTYVRGFIRGKIFQLALPEEVQPMSSKAQRVLTNGHLVLTMPKVKQIIKPVIVPLPKPSKDSRTVNESSSSASRMEKLEVDPNAHKMVDFTNIVKENEKSSVRAPLGSNQPWWTMKLEEKSPSADFVDDPEVPPLM